MPPWAVADVRVAVQEGPVGRILELATVEPVVVDVGVGVGAGAQVLDLWQEGVDGLPCVWRDVVAVVGDRVGRLERVGVKDVAGHAVRGGRLSYGGVVVQKFGVHHVPTKPCAFRYAVVDMKEKTLRVDDLCNFKELVLWKRRNARKTHGEPAVEDLLRLQLDRGLPCTVDGQPLDDIRLREVAVDADQAFYKGARASDRLDAAGAVAGAEAGSGAVKFTGTCRATLKSRLAGALRRSLLVQEAGAVARAYEFVHHVELVGVGQFNVCVAHVKARADVLAGSSAVRAFRGADGVVWNFAQTAASQGSQEVGAVADGVERKARALAVVVALSPAIAGDVGLRVDARAKLLAVDPAARRRVAGSILVLANEFRVAKVFLLVGAEGKLTVVHCPGVPVFADSKERNFDALERGRVGKAVP